jgi:putative transposase
VVNRGNGRQTVFHDEDDYASLLELIGKACERTPMRVAGLCLMPNHFHLIVRPSGDGDLSRWMQWLMTSHVRRHHRRYGTSGHVWQGRFKSFPIQQRRLSRADKASGTVKLPNPVLQVLRYVERNPVRAGMVTSAERWPWSSVSWWAGQTDAPEWWQAEAIWRPDNWLEWVNRPQTEKELAALRRCIARGRPFGSERWVEKLATDCGLESTLRPRGRPRKWKPKPSKK